MTSRGRAPAGALPSRIRPVTRVGAVLLLLASCCGVLACSSWAKFADGARDPEGTAVHPLLALILLHLKSGLAHRRVDFQQDVSRPGKFVGSHRALWFGRDHPVTMRNTEGDRAGWNGARGPSPSARAGAPVRLAAPSWILRTASPRTCMSPTPHGFTVRLYRLRSRTPLPSPRRTHTVRVRLSTDQKAGGSSPSGRTTCGNAFRAWTQIHTPMHRGPSNLLAVSGDRGGPCYSTTVDDLEKKDPSPPRSLDSSAWGFRSPLRHGLVHTGPRPPPPAASSPRAHSS
jgi:hypothetical protein